MRRIGSLFENRALDALAKSLVCFAVLHQMLLLVHVVQGGDLGAYNVFTMLEADRLAPALGSGAVAQWLSALFALVVYGLVLVLWTHERTSDHGRMPRQVIGLYRPTLLGGMLVFAIGLVAHNLSLTWIERLTTHFPSVPDVLMARMPYVAFGWPGELCFLAFLATIVVVLSRLQPRTIPAVLTKLGLFYGFRGLFLFFLPIGAPPDAPALENRFVLYPWANHAYFPGGHVGLMTVMSLAIQHMRWRRGLLFATALFAIGTLLARTHYTADALGGWLLAYAITAWGRRHLGSRPSAPAAFPVEAPADLDERRVARG